MKVGWLADTHDPPGGAEFTQAEFRAAAPKGVEIIACPPGQIAPADLYVVHNIATYPGDTRFDGPVVRYFHDLDPHTHPDLRRRLLEDARCIFTSPLHRERFPWPYGDSALIPPAVNLEPFRASRNGHKREGMVSVGSWMNPGKAPHLAAELGDVDFYGRGPFAPDGSEPVARRDLPELLARYATFVYLPTAVEPFGRTVVEAWASGMKVVTNRLVGARYWIEEQPDKLDTAAADFWQLILQ